MWGMGGDRTRYRGNKYDGECLWSRGTCGIGYLRIETLGLGRGPKSLEKVHDLLLGVRSGTDGLLSGISSRS